MSRRSGAALRPPIILFGNFRSGTSIVQRALAVHPDVVAWYEPNSLWLCADPGRDHDEFDERDATDRVKRYVRRRFLRYQQEHGDAVVMEKSPHNILRIPYVKAILPEATFMYMVRDPFSFISSVELKWQRPVTTSGAIRRLRETPLQPGPPLRGQVRAPAVRQEGPEDPVPPGMGTALPRHARRAVVHRHAHRDRPPVGRGLEAGRARPRRLRRRCRPPPALRGLRRGPGRGPGAHLCPLRAADDRRDGRGGEGDGRARPHPEVAATRSAGSDVGSSPSCATR